MMWPLLALLAQTSATDPLAGGAGWVGTGLLGAVLSWLLLRHLPAKDAQLKEFQEAKDKHLTKIIADCDAHNDEVVKSFVAQISQQRQDFATQSEQQRKDFQEALRFVAAQNEKYVAALAEALRQELQAVRSELRQGKSHE